MLSYKKATFWIILAAIIACIILAVVFLTNPPEKDNTEDNSSVSGVGGVDPPSSVIISPTYITVNELKEKHPEYFGLDTSKGLEVYIWQMAKDSYSCGLMSGTNRNKTKKELLALKSTSITEMRLILDTYDIDKDNIIIIPIHQSYSSHHYLIDEEYTKKVTALFWAEPISYNFSHGRYSFELPHAKCTILAVSFAKSELSLTVEWETEEGFTESTKTEYPNYHVKFTVGDSEHFTFLPLPSEWEGDSMTVTDVYCVNMPIDTSNTKRFAIDLYLSDDKTLVRNLLTVFMPTTSEGLEFNFAIDDIEFDIDGDGVAETCTLAHGPTSGLYSFRILVHGNGELEVGETFIEQGLYFMEGFYKDENGRVSLKGVKHDDIRYYDISVKDGRIVLVSQEDGTAYYGNLTSLSPKKYDVDADGVAETFHYSSLPLMSSLNQGEIIAKVDGKIKYSSIIRELIYVPLGFYTNDDGKLTLKCLNTKDKSVHYFDIGMKDGKLVFTCGEYTLKTT